MSKIAFFSDLHLGNHVPFSSKDEDKLNTRMIRCLRVLEEVVRKSLVIGVDDIVFCGDFFHNGKSISPDILVALGYLLDDLDELFGPSVSLHIMPGQHDYVDREGMWAATDVLSVLGALYLRTWTYLGGSTVKLSSVVETVFNPYSYDGNKLKEQLKALSPRKVMGFIDGSVSTSLSIFVGHFLVKELLEEAGSPSIRADISVSDLPKGFDFYFIGDMHQPVNVGNVYSVGTCCPTSFSDAGIDPSFIILDTDTKCVDRVVIDCAPRFWIVDGAVEQLNPNHFYDIRVSSVEEEYTVRERFEDFYNFKCSVYSDSPDTVMASRLDADEAGVSSNPADIMAEYAKQKDADEGMTEFGIKRYSSGGNE